MNNLYIIGSTRFSNNFKKFQNLSKRFTTTFDYTLYQNKHKFMDVILKVVMLKADKDDVILFEVPTYGVVFADYSFDIDLQFNTDELEYISIDEYNVVIKNVDEKCEGFDEFKNWIFGSWNNKFDRWVYEQWLVKLNHIQQVNFMNKNDNFHAWLSTVEEIYV